MDHHTSSCQHLLVVKKAVINIMNNDDACFAWAVISALYPDVNHPERVSSYVHYSSVLNLAGITFPMKISNIKHFENINSEISINVYGLEDKEIVGPLYFTKNKKQNHINLLLIEDNLNTHYSWIKNFNRLIGSQLSQRQNKKYLCDGCLVYFREEDQLKRHIESDCNTIKSVVPKSENALLKFKNFNHKLEVPFVIYCDFETLLLPISSCQPNPNQSSTVDVQIHKPFSFAYYIKCSYDDSLSKFVTYRGLDCGKVFIQNISDDLKLIVDKIFNIIPMIKLNSDQERQYINSTKCFICEMDFTDDEEKVRDHCHLTGKFRGPAHLKCNFHFAIPDFVPLVCHNLSGYDAHFIIRELNFDNKAITLLAQNKE